MTMQQTMTGSDGVEVTAYKRSARQLRAGDYLPEHDAHVVTDAVEDPDDGATWVTLDDGRDLRITTRRVWMHRRYSAPEWMRDAVDAYRAARDARDAARESGGIVPAGAVAGAAGAAIAWLAPARAGRLPACVAGATSSGVHPGRRGRTTGAGVCLMTPRDVVEVTRSELRAGYLDAVRVFPGHPPMTVRDARRIGTWQYVVGFVVGAIRRRVTCVTRVACVTREAGGTE